MANPYKTFEPKDPNEILDYLFDWAGKSNNNGLADWLEPDELIVTCNLTVPDGLTLETSEVVLDGTAVLMWLSGGTAGNNYEIKCKIETSMGRTAIRTAILPVKIM